MSKVGSDVIQSLKDAIAFVKGEANPEEYVIHIPADIDVKRIRRKLKMTQKQFASNFGFSVATVRHWEHNIRKPEGPTRAYLKVIEHNPAMVQNALREELRAC